MLYWLTQLLFDWSSCIQIYNCISIELYSCIAVPLSHCPTVPLSHCLTVLLSHGPTVPLSHSPTVLLSHCPRPSTSVPYGLEGSGLPSRHHLTPPMSFYPHHGYSLQYAWSILRRNHQDILLHLDVQFIRVSVWVTILQKYIFYARGKSDK